MRRHPVFILFFISVWNPGWGQDNFSDAFIYSTRNIHVYVPALACIDNPLQSNLIFKTYTGKLSIIRSQYADINVNIKKAGSEDQRNSKHILGLGFFSDREGDFFNKIRIIGRYALHIPLSQDFTLSGGAALHIVNYKFNASGSGASGSDIAWSGNIAVAIYSPSFRAGLAFNDLNNPHLKPIRYEFILYRYNTLYAEKELLIGQNTYLKGGGRLNLTWGNSYSTLVHFGLVFSRAVGLTCFYNVNKGWGLAADINKIKIAGDNLIDFSFAYQVPSQDQNPPASQYEINVRYYLNR